MATLQMDLPMFLGITKTFGTQRKLDFCCFKLSIHFLQQGEASDATPPQYVSLVSGITKTFRTRENWMSAASNFVSTFFSNVQQAWQRSRWTSLWFQVSQKLSVPRENWTFAASNFPSTFCAKVQHTRQRYTRTDQCVEA